MRSKPRKMYKYQIINHRKVTSSAELPRFRIKQTTNLYRSEPIVERNGEISQKSDGREVDAH